MAVAEVGSIGTLSDVAVSPTRSLSYTLDAAANLLFVWLIWAELGETLSTFTWGGVALTSVGTPANDGVHLVQFFIKTNPATGNANLVPTFTGDQFYIIMGAMGLSGVDTGTPTSSYVTGTATSQPSPASIDPVTSATGDRVVNGWSRDTTATATAQNQAEKFRILDNDPFLVGAGGTADGASSVDPGWTYSGNATWAMASVNIKAAAGGGAPGAIIYNRMIG